MNRTLVFGYVFANTAARSRPPRFGITTSVIRRWMGSPNSAATRIAASPSAASSTLYPYRSSIRRVTARTAATSSTTRTVSVPRVVSAAALAVSDTGSSTRGGRLLVRRVEIEVGRLHRQPAPVGHGGACIPAEVHDHLLELAGVPSHRA